MDDLTHAAAGFNLEAGVTGVLLHDGSRFQQFMEGPDDGVDVLYARIHGAGRHHGIVELGRDSIPGRLLPYWSMRWLPAKPADCCKMLGCADLFTDAINVVAGQRVCGAKKESHIALRLLTASWQGPWILQPSPLPEGPVMSTQEQAAPPGIVRLEAMPLDCGESVVVVELASAPGRGWVKALKRMLADADGLEMAQLRCDGRFVYIIGVDLAQRGTTYRINQALAAASERGRQRMPPALPAPAATGTALAAAD